MKEWVSCYQATTNHSGAILISFKHRLLFEGHCSRDLVWPCLLVAFLSLTSSAIQAATITVDSTADTTVAGDGGCTLREAMLNANANSDSTNGDCSAGSSAVTDTIRFNISGAAPVTITVTSNFPSITDAVLIDGTTQPGNTGVCTTSIPTRPDYALIITGGNTVGNGFFLTTGSDGSTIKGLNIERFRNFDIKVGGSTTGNLIECNFIGTNHDGSAAQSTRGRAVWITDTASSNTVRYNLLSGNEIGVHFSSSPTNNSVLGNFMGTDRSGTGAIPNQVGVRADGGASQIIGVRGTSNRNLLSGNSGFGILLGGNSATIYNNYIGTDPTGTVALPNATGVSISGNDNELGGPRSDERNIIAGSTGNGVQLGSSASGNQVRNNYIGTDVTGELLLGNGGYGVSVAGPGNWIGVNSFDFPGNTISGNGLGGVLIKGVAADDNQLRGNRIGTNPSATAVLGNSGHGVSIEEGADRNGIGNNRGNLSNYIGGNSGDGVFIDFDNGLGLHNTLVFGNYIGTDATGTVDLGNTGHGVFVGRNTRTAAIGVIQVNADFENVIAFNDGAGVVVSESTSYDILIQGNLMYQNGGLGIDLSDDGPTPNDPGDGDGGPNRRQNYPALSGSIDCTGDLTLTYSLDTPLAVGGQHEVHVYKADVDGDEGEIVILDDFYGNPPSPNAKVVNLGSAAALGVSVGDLLVGTGTHGDFGTSEFSPGVAVQSACVFTVTNGNSSGAGSLHQALLDANAALAPAVVAFAISGSGPHVIANGALPTITNQVFVDGASQSGSSGVCTSAVDDRPTYQVALDGVDQSFDGIHLGAGSDGSTVRGINLRNFDAGIRMTDSGEHTIACNFIGTDATGFLNESNTTDVVVGDLGGNTIGGSDEADGNLLGFGDDGIVIPGAASIGNNLRGNTFLPHSNLDIDLGISGRNSNDTDDADSGANQLQNYPELSGAEISDDVLTLDYSIDADPANQAYPIEVDLFKVDNTFLGDGRIEHLMSDTYELGDGTVTLTGSAAALGVSGGHDLVALATDADGNTSELSQLVDIIPPEIDLAVQISEARDPVMPGETQTFIVTISNPSLDLATGVVVTPVLTLPTGVTVSSIVPSVGNFNVGIWVVGDIPSASSATLEIEVAVSAAAAQGTDVIRSEAGISNHEEPDPVSANNSAAETSSIVWPATDLALTSTTPGISVAGTSLTWGIQVANSGPIDSTGSIVTHPLPSGWSLASSTGSCASDGATPAETVTCSLGPIATSANLAYEIELDVPPSAFGNEFLEASVVPSGAQADPVASNNADGGSVSVLFVADLAVSVAESADPVMAGSGSGNLVYSVTVTNDGPSDLAPDADVALTLPSGVSLESAAPSTGSYSGSTWSIGRMIPGATETLALTLTVTSSAPDATDAIAVSATLDTNADPNPDNDSDSEATSIVGCPLVVRSTADSGDGSLRTVLACANARPGLDTVSFAIDGSGPHTILPLSALPTITDGVMLDGTSEPDYAGTPVVILDGQLAGAGVDGLTFQSSGNEVTGLAITGFTGSALVVTDGVAPDNDAINNTLTENSYFGNGGLSIDLGGDGATANDSGDADTGANQLQNSPVIERVTTSAGSVDLTYFIDSEPANASYPLTIEFAIADADGEEGQTVVGTDDYTKSDHGGCGTAPCAKTITLTTTTATGVALVATATDSDGNTSEFSATAPLLEATKIDAVTGGGDAIPGSTVTYTVTLTNPGTEPATNVVLSDTPDANTTLVANSGAITGAVGASFGYTGGVFTATLDDALPGLGASVAITFDVTVVTPLPSGVDSVCNQGTVTADGPLSALTDDPDVGGITDPTCTAVEPETVPTVRSVDSVASSRDGRIVPNEHVFLPITQLYLTFSEEVTGADIAASFQVVGAGTDGVVSTVSCAGGLLGDDVLAPIVSAAYDNPTSRLDLSTGSALPRGHYRLYACGSAIEDLSGNTLDGDGDGTGGDDFTLDFAISADDLVSNPNFDDDLAPWTSLDFVWSTEDADQAPTSGSAEVLLPDADRLLTHPCIDVAGETGIGSILSARIFDPSLGAPAVTHELSFFDGADCTGTSLGTASLSRLEGDISLEWLAVLGWAGVADGAVSALPTLRYTAAGASPNEVQIDRLMLTPMIFGDGFESGDTSSWSGSQP